MLAMLNSQGLDSWIRGWSKNQVALHKKMFYGCSNTACQQLRVGCFGCSIEGPAAVCLLDLVWQVFVIIGTGG